ncbi:MAG: hypothetical protein U0271_32840 [Polyangiaceae bacterium]
MRKLVTRALASLALASAACGPDLGARGTQVAAGACTETPDACEDAIVRAIQQGADATPALEAYVAARTAKDPNDALASALASARETGKRGRALVVLEGGAKAPSALSQGPDATIPRIEIAALSLARPTSIEPIWVAVAEAANLDYLAVIGADGSLVRAFGHDAVPPGMGGLVPAVRDTDPELVAGDVSIERELRATLASVAAYRYSEAADHLDALDALASREPPFDAAALRAHIVINATGLRSALPAAVSAAAATAPATSTPEPAAHETAYYDLLRVRTDPRAAHAYEKRRDRIVAAAPAGTAALFDRTWSDAPPSSCDEVVLPTFEREADLTFVGLLPGALLPAGARSRGGRLGLADWYERYARAVDLAEKRGFSAMLVTQLLAERGGSAFGVRAPGPAANATHARVTQIGVSHAKALVDLAAARPGELGFSQLGFLAAAAAASDPELSRALTTLAKTFAREAVGSTTDPWDLVTTTVLGVFSSGSMPREVQAAHLSELALAYSDRLHTDLAKKTGWGVAAAYALDLAWSLVGFAPNTNDDIANFSRALETDASIAEPGLAALASAFARYASLAASGTLGAPLLEAGDQAKPDREAARAALKRALARLGEHENEADPKTLDALADLADGVAATLAYALSRPTPSAPSPKPSKSAASKPQSCERPATSTPDPKLTRALAKLADRAKQLSSNKVLTAGETVWEKRAALVALLLSDGIDIAIASNPKAANEPLGGLFGKLALVGFASDEPRARSTVRSALGTFGAGDSALDAAEKIYGVARGLLARGRGYFDTASVAELRTLLHAAAALLRDADNNVTGLFDAMADALGESSGAASLANLPTVVANLFDRGEKDHAETLLMLAFVVGRLTEAPLPAAVYASTDQPGSRVGWLMDFMRFSIPAKSRPAGPPRFEAGLERLVAERCGQASTQTFADVLAATERFRSGERAAGRADLARALDSVGAELAAPNVAFQFRQETGTRAFNVSVDLNLGAPFVTNASSFSLGGGFRSPGEPRLGLDVSVTSADAPAARLAAGRYWLHATAVLAVYDFLAGDTAAAEATASKVLGALVQRSWLSPAPYVDPAALATGAEGTLALLAEYLIENDRPLLGGALLRVLRTSLPAELATVDDLVAPLSNLPPALADLSDLGPVIERAKTTLERAGAGLACVGPKLDKATFVRPTCATYATGLSLRVADSLTELPILTAKKGETCDDLAALDNFLNSVQASKYDGDKLVDAATKLLDAKKPGEAAFLLSRQRAPQHCTRAVVDLLRRAAAELPDDPFVRADLLTGLVDCEGTSTKEVVLPDLLALDDAARALHDPARERAVAIFAGGMSLTFDDASLMRAITEREGFVERRRTDTTELLVGVLFHFAARGLAGEAGDMSLGAREIELVCSPRPSPGFDELCDTLDKLRNPELDSAARKKVARQMIGAMMGGP